VTQIGGGFQARPPAHQKIGPEVILDRANARADRGGRDAQDLGRILEGAAPDGHFHALK